MNKTASNARLKASLEELARFGCPVDESVAVTEVENEDVEIEQVGGIVLSQIFPLQDRRVGCIVDIGVTNRTSRTIDLIDVELRTPWDNRLLEWLLPSQVKFQTSRKRDCSALVYRFPGPGPEFAYNEVINHHLLERKKLPGKCWLEGWLLGIGGFMPDNLVHGDWLEMPLTIIGAHAEYTTTTHLWTERLLVGAKIAKTRTSIFPNLVEEEAVRARDITRTAPLRASKPPASNRT
jgi:hypothetical protein